VAQSISTTPIATHQQAPSTRRDSALAYQRPDTAMTLRQGLAEYFHQSGELMDPSELPEDLGVGLRAHDVAHVVFGCDTTLVGEAVLVRWTLFGVTGSIRPYLIGLRRRETRGLFRDAFAAFRVAMFWPIVKFSTLAIVRSLRMRERWPFEGYAEYLDQPLCEIREHFGIRVFGPV
jgi:hypothetical protein